jgi:hypothetical protein
MNVLVDRHHAGLYHSLQLLVRRLGWTLYTPIGHDWWDEWYWSFGRSTYNDDRLALQYLMAAQEPDGEYPDWPINFVTLSQARAMPWEFVIATLQDNQMGFAKFAREQGARFVVQVGNTGQNIEWEHEPLVLSSSEMPILGRGVVYHQEFDSAGTFAFREPVVTRTVRCFVHLLHETVCYPEWQAFRAALPDWTVVRYGHAPTFDDPSYVENAKPTAKIAALMGISDWGWHDKPHGDGFGHILHGWAAIGRPLIGHASHYRGKMGEPFWRDGETCIDLDRHSVAEAAEIVRGIRRDEHAAMCRAIRATFDELVDYDREADAIRALLAPEAVAA